MTKRYSDTLRERADEVRYSPDAQSQCEGPGPFLLGWAAALYSVSVELDSPEFSGRIVYEQRNAALEEVARLKQRIAELERYAWRPITADSMPPRDSVVECWQCEHAGTCEVQWGKPSPDREPTWWIGYRYCTDEQLRRICSHWRYLTPPETNAEDGNG